MVFEPATENDREELMALYRAQVGREGCPWTDEYPSNDTIAFDLKRDALLVLREEDKIIGTVSIDDDESVNNLPCWNKNLEPEVEFSRIAVRTDMQGRGIGKILLGFLLEELKKRGYHGAHILVNKYNTKALRLYDAFDFKNVGECHMHEQDYYCYELELK